MDRDSKPQRPLRTLFRFSLFSLFMAISCVAGYFGGYRWGAKQRDQDNYKAAITVQTYDVADLLTPVPNGLGGTKVSRAEFAPLIDLIVSTINHDQWLDNGTGMNEIHPFPKNMTLVVSCPGETHDEIVELFRQLRDLRYKLPDYRLKMIREAVARKKEDPNIIKYFSKLTPEVERRMQNHFDSTVREMTHVFGSPSRIDEAGAADFPTWAVAQRIAVWDYSGGKLYLALQDCRPQGQALIAGWWEDAFGTMQPTRFANEAIAKSE